MHKAEPSDVSDLQAQFYNLYVLMILDDDKDVYRVSSVFPHTNENRTKWI